MKNIFLIAVVCGVLDKTKIWCEAKCFYDDDKKIGIILNNKCHCAYEVDLKEVGFKLKGLVGGSDTKQRVTYEIRY